MLILEPDGPRVAAGTSTLDVCAEALGAPPGDLPALVRALTSLEPRLADALADLAASGREFDLHVRGTGIALRAEGRVSGALALVSLALAAPSSPIVAEKADAGQVRGLSDTVRRQTEAQGMILDAAADAVAILGPDGRLDYHNPAFESLWGLPPAWLAERPSHGALLDRLRQDRRLPESADYASFRAAELARRESPGPAPDAIWRVGGERTLRVRSLPHPAGGLVLLFSDITPDVRLKSQFTHLIQVQRATLDKLTDAVAVFGADARLKLHNEAFQALWAVPSEALTGEPRFDDLAEYCVAVLPDMSFWRALKGRIADPDPGVRGAAQGEAPAADGRRLAWQSRPLPDGATLVGFADVTNTHRLEQALRDREAALDAAGRMGQDFVSSVSYELRTPLTTILGYSELLEGASASLPARARDWVAAVREAAADLARSVEDILTFAQIDSGELSLDLVAIGLSDLLGEASARAQRRAEIAGVAVAVDAGAEAGAIRVDAPRLARVLDHLIEHAVRQTPSGGQVILSARRALGEVCLEVADTGRGIPFHIQAHIFDRFGGEEGAGAGLGLALVKALVERHGGWVAVESAPGAGARFACHLPDRLSSV